MSVFAIVALGLATQDPVLERFGLKPVPPVVAVDGKATIADGETMELVGAADLADPRRWIWDANGRLVDQVRRDLFWKILDDRPPSGNLDKRDSETYVMESFGQDEDKRSFAMAFRLSAGLTKAWDVREDVNKKFALLLSQTKAATGSQGTVGEARILRPVFPKDHTGTTFDIRFEVPGGEWKTIAEFPFGPDTTLADGLIEIKMRWQQHSDFRMVEDRQTIVDYKGYYFTLILPAALREMELEIVTNDPPEDAALLPSVVQQHIRGEDQHEAYKGRDLFLVYGLNSRSEARKFTLRARPKRIVEFRGIPFKRD